ncbi:substrate-binding domain-containing protein [Amphibacillus cookii]|uniref:substrate-binding domain-containing protein n=1 Tax=Amphibacillus cookii TaxID=767787 RepID=UPI00195A6A7C|nr:substrate-binding domain-containing protein [Amphibacillus cookii]MBM7539964.1 ribose transport system substrate-binding protein [Amphibacillus cookii]
MNKKAWRFILIFTTVSVLSYSLYLYIKINALNTAISDQQETEQLNNRPHIVMIGEVYDHDYWNFVHDGARAYADEHGLYLDYRGPRQSNPDEQLTLLVEAIEIGVDGILVQALNEQFIPYIDQAIERDIPVITIDTDQPESNRISYVGTDNYLAGQLAAEAVLESQSSAEIGIITGSFTNHHHHLRLTGFKETIEKETGFHVVAEEASDIKQINAREKAYAMLKDYPEINVLYGTSALDVLGINKALDSLEREDIYVVGFDTLPENVELFESGQVDVLIGQEPKQIGYLAMDVLEKVLKGENYQAINHTDIKVLK